MFASFALFTFAVVAGGALGIAWRSRRPCTTCRERADVEAAQDALAHEPETLERLKSLRVDPAVLVARTTAVQLALQEAGLHGEFWVGPLGWCASDQKKGAWVLATRDVKGVFNDELACQHLPAFLAEAEKRLRARNAGLRKAGISAP